MSNQYPPSSYGDYGTPVWGAPRPRTAVYAGWGLRVLATIVDGLLVIPFVVVAVVVLAGQQDVDGEPTGPALALAGLVYLLAVVFGIWNQIFRQGRTGASIGKTALGIKVLKESTGLPLGAGMTFVRQVCHIVDSLPCYIGYLWPLWDSKKQTFADKIVGTVVVADAT